MAIIKLGYSFIFYNNLIVHTTLLLVENASLFAKKSIQK